VIEIKSEKDIPLYANFGLRFIEYQVELRIRLCRLDPASTLFTHVYLIKPKSTVN